MRVGTKLKVLVNNPLNAGLKRGDVVTYVGGDVVRAKGGITWLTLAPGSRERWGGQVFSDHFRVIRRKAKKGGK